MPTPPNTGEPVPARVRVLEAKEPNNLTDEQRKWPVVEPEINPGERFTMLPPSGPVPVKDGSLRGRLAALSDQDRQVFTLHCLDGLTPRQIGERLGMTPAAVAASVRRAAERLRAAFA